MPKAKPAPLNKKTRPRWGPYNRNGLTTMTHAEQWRPGMILLTPHITPLVNPNERSVYKLRSRTVGTLCAKTRYAIVVAVYKERMTLLPVLSACGNGLTNKSTHYKTLAMLVKKKSEATHTDTQRRGQSSIETLHVDNESWHPTRGSHVLLNEVLTVSYRYPLGFVGALTEDSTDLCCKRFWTALEMGRVNLSEQMNYYRNEVAKENVRADA